MKIFPPIADSQTDRFALTRGPDGIYLVDGRVIPVADHARAGVNDGQPVVGIQGHRNPSVSLVGVHIGADVEQRKLELMPQT